MFEIKKNEKQKLNDQSFSYDSCILQWLFEVPWQRGGRNVELQPFSQVPLILLQAFPSAHFPHSELQSSL